MQTHIVEVKPAEIREAWSTIQDGQTPFKRAHAGTLSRCVETYRGEDVHPWIGASGTQIQHRLEHGYEVDSKDVDVSGASEYRMPAPLLDDEQGDLLVDQVLGGEDLYRVQWEDHTAPKSLRIRACMGMHAGVQASVIGAYMEWVLKVADAAIRDGFVPSIELWIGAREPWKTKGHTLIVNIPLVEPGEVIDIAAWRAYLTPGAFRSLGFVAMGLASEKARKTLNSGMGSPTNKSWAVRFDADESTLEIECPGGAPSFDEDLMDILLAQAYDN